MDLLILFLTKLITIFLFILLINITVRFIKNKKYRNKKFIILFIFLLIVTTISIFDFFNIYNFQRNLIDLYLTYQDFDTPIFLPEPEYSYESNYSFTGDGNMHYYYKLKNYQIKKIVKKISSEKVFPKFRKNSSSWIIQEWKATPLKKNEYKYIEKAIPYKWPKEMKDQVMNCLKNDYSYYAYSYGSKDFLHKVDFYIIDVEQNIYYYFNSQ